MKDDLREWLRAMIARHESKPLIRAFKVQDAARRKADSR